MRFWWLITIYWGAGLHGQPAPIVELWPYKEELACLEQREKNELALEHLIELTCVPDFTDRTTGNKLPLEYHK